MLSGRARDDGRVPNTSSSAEGVRPGLGWLKAGAIGQFGLAVAAVVVLVAGAARPSRRRGAAVMAGAVIALEAVWFLLTRMLTAS